MVTDCVAEDDKGRFRHLWKALGFVLAISGTGGAIATLGLTVAHYMRWSFFEATVGRNMTQILLGAPPAP